MLLIEGLLVFSVQSLFKNLGTEIARFGIQFGCHNPCRRVLCSAAEEYHRYGKGSQKGEHKCFFSVSGFSMFMVFCMLHTSGIVHVFVVSRTFMSRAYF
jgi:hypothetical protein